MGLGGHLLWTAVIRRLHETSGHPVRVVYAPLPSDLLAGRLYRGDVSLTDDPIFLGNPRIEFPPSAPKSALARTVDRVGMAAIRRLGLQDAYERTVWRRSRARTGQTGQVDAHIDLNMHSYAARELPDRMIWKTGGHIVDIILAGFGETSTNHQGEMYLSAAEEEDADAICRRHGLGRDFVVIEPNSKADWFGDLRAWPIDRWQDVVTRIAQAGRCRVVQVGEAGGHRLRDVLDLGGQLPVRTTIALMKRARLFLGLEGGLMHAASAVNVPSVIVWGGLTLPEFAAYPDRHRVLCTYVECAPCGLRGGCPYDKKCLTSIAASGVIDAIVATSPDVLGGRTH
jgi:hypothetical protein